jgi:ABC-type glycerol-3-phosphate transport system substrate-binding protein
MDGAREGQRGWTRRRLIGGALSLGGVAAGMALAGSTTLAAGRAARPAASGGKIRLTVSIAYQGNGTYQGTMQHIVDDYLAKHWLPSHPGVELTTISGMGCNGNCLGAQDEIANSLAGNPADVIAGCCGQWYEYLVADMLRPLDSFIRRDNIDLGIFSPGHLAGLTTPKGILALPEYDGPEVVAVNLGLLDQLGLPYPSDDWTYTEAERLWRSVAGVRNGNRLYAINADVPDDWVPVAWGGAVGNAAGTVCTLDSPQAIAAYEWWMPLKWGDVVGGNDLVGGPPNCAMNMQGGWDIQSDLFRYKGLKWRYYPMPRFAVRQGTFINNDFYAINNYSRNPPDLVWDIFKFVVLDPGFQKLEWQTTFVTPNRVDLWDEWLQVVYAVAPGLRDKNLEAFAGAVKYGTAQYFFKYNNSATDSLKGKYFGMMQNRQLSVVSALQEMTARINAIEAAGAAVAAAQAAQAAQVQAELKAAAAGTVSSFPPPARSGFGVPYAAAGPLVQVRGGTYTLTGSGSVSGTTDHATFACAAATAARATYTCRLTAFANVNESAMDHGAKAGLMLRQDLSDDCPAVFVNISQQEGITANVQQFAQVDATHPFKAGNGSALMLPLSGGSGKNFLKAPVWLRLARQGGRFQLFWSVDGAHWKAAGGLLEANIAAGWIGVFVASHESPQEVRATFDHLEGFTPDAFVVLGGGS